MKSLVLHLAVDVLLILPIWLAGNWYIKVRIWRKGRREVAQIIKIAYTEPPWAGLFSRRCRARKEPNPTGFWGRCELVQDHIGIDHHLERGMHLPTWSTEWTS